jgi:hypothetical protein
VAGGGVWHKKETIELEMGEKIQSVFVFIEEKTTELGK